MYARNHEWTKCLSLAEKQSPKILPHYLVRETWRRAFFLGGGFNFLGLVFGFFCLFSFVFYGMFLVFPFLGSVFELFPSTKCFCLLFCSTIFVSFVFFSRFTWCRDYPEEKSRVYWPFFRIFESPENSSWFLRNRMKVFSSFLV